MKRRHWLLILLTISIGTAAFPPALSAKPLAEAKATKPSLEELRAERRALFDKMESLTGIPWFYIAAIDQYERTMNFVKKDRPKDKEPIAIYYTAEQWAGMLNPYEADQNPATIQFFNGIGIDGSGDEKADRNNDLDVLFTMTNHLLRYGTSLDDFRIALWEYYQNSRSVERITEFAKIYEQFGRLDLSEKSFPVSRRGNYSYRGTWGASRSWGGYRIHEGTDIFASYGLPVLSTSYGYVEVMGWNPYGGWRVGIRDLNNVYYYFAHLTGYAKGLKQGDVVKPGQVIGYVGSSGYGKPGTQGKFPPHLHFGMYRDNGYTEWSFDPYPYLRKWERQRVKLR